MSPRPPGSTQTPRLSGTAAVVAVVAGSFVIGWSAILVELSAAGPATVSVYRLGYAAVMLWIVVAAEFRWRRLPISWTDLRPGPRTSGAGALFALSVLMQNVSIEALGAGLATVLDNTHVIVIALAGWLVAGRPPRRTTMVAIGLVLVGIIAISTAERSTADDGAYTWGVPAALATACAYAAYIALLKDGGHPAGARSLALPVCRVVTVAFLIALPFAVMSGADLAPPPAAHGWLLLLAAGPQVLGWTLIAIGARTVDVLTTGLILTLQPVVSVVLAAAVLHERLTVVQGVGCSLVMAGLGLTTWPTGRGTGHATAASVPTSSGRLPSAGARSHM